MGCFGGKFAAQDFHFVGAPVSENLALQRHGCACQFFGLTSFDAFDAGQGDMAGKVLFRLFGREFLDRLLDRPLQSKQLLLPIVH